MTRVYLAGPMTGLPDNNFPAFRAAASHLRAQGLDVENPADNPAPATGAWRDYLRLAIAQLVRCDEVRVLPGWQRSRGATLEVHIAHQLDIPVLEYEPKVESEVTS